MAFLAPSPRQVAVPARRRLPGACRPARRPRYAVRACVSAEVSADTPWYLRGINFCAGCGGTLQMRTAPGESVVRPVCTDCGTPVYVNPKTICGAVVLSADRKSVLLGQRDIPPSVGKWTYPSGFMEVGENTKQGAEREALEETLATIACTKLLAVYNIPAIAQVHVVYLAELHPDSQIGAGPESMAARLFPWDQIPWDELAFPTTKWALEYASTSHNLATMEPQLRTKLHDGTFQENS